ncbi:MAG TPA: HlyD family secretion protein [Blastocatellia bacterium]|nr:HlyD family secretion protein [Blastocatellia bacterium]
MNKMTTDISVQEREFSTTGRNGSLPRTNGNGASTKQLPIVVDEPETDLGDAVHESAEQEAQDTSTRSSARSKRRMLFAVIGILLLLGAVVGVRYWVHSRLYESTDDAFIEGHATQVSPKVSGYVQKIYIDDNQLVKAGDLLVEIDPRDYDARLAQARATLNAAIARRNAAKAALSLTRVTASAGVEQASSGVEAARSSVAQARSAASAAEGRVKQSSTAISTAEANVGQAQAQVAAAEAEAVRAGADVIRYRSLFDKEVVSRQQLDQATAAAATADAQLEAARRRVAAAESTVSEARAAQGAASDQYTQSLSQITGTQAQVGQASGKLSEANSAPQQVAVRQSEVETTSAEIEQAEATVRQAELDLSYTKIYAPEDGRVTRKAVEQGALLQPGQALFVLVPAEMWVLANFKETQLNRMRTGQVVEIKVDAYPEKIFKGHVDSFQTGTGSRFSLLPPENATGNYVKVVQRLPVKIVFDEQSDSEHLLAPGMSVEPEVRVR